MAIVRVAVIERTVDKKTDFLVRPSVVFLEEGDVFRVLNTTQHEVTILPATAQSASTPHGFLNLSAKGASHVIDKEGVFETVARGKGPNNGCRYHIEVNFRGKMCVAGGDSDPVIIIDNP